MSEELDVMARVAPVRLVTKNCHGSRVTSRNTAYESRPLGSPTVGWMRRNSEKTAE